MSWYNRKPKPREPARLAPKHSSPIAEKLLKEQKESVRGTVKKKNDK
jgi:hypothetical protein